AKHPELALEVNVISQPKDGRYAFGTIDLIDLKIVDMATFHIGEVSHVGGDAAFQYVKKVIELALTKEIDATVTN
ncbi:4-hydroxythreonine-4-phosphate dehydrogenase PdxA, partial [Acinetobacter soli]|nr:4-hydroxythreonine-4-phosphate dehydrogenase PdxA [Acinetobacter soli]